MSTTVSRLIAGRYELKHRLCSGGFSEVFLAEDRSTDTPVAVKMHGARAEQSPTVLELDHPNIVRQLDEGVDRDEHFAVFEYVRGMTLRERLGAGPLSLHETERLAADLAAGLDYCHQRGIAHNDVKPENIILGAEGAKLLDFGASRSLLETVSTTDAPDLMMTIVYAAPEILDGEVPDERSDIYSLALVLVEALVGRVPPGLRQHAQTSVVTRLLPADVPAAFAITLTEALSPYPEVRPAHAASLARALEPVPEPVVPIVANSRRQYRTARPAAVAACVAVALFGALLLPRALPGHSELQDPPGVAMNGIRAAQAESLLSLSPTPTPTEEAPAPTASPEPTAAPTEAPQPAPQAAPLERASSSVIIVPAPQASGIATIHLQPPQTHPSTILTTPPGQAKKDKPEPAKPPKNEPKGKAKGH
jgi:serine/threonine protein kinase